MDKVLEFANSTNNNRILRITVGDRKEQKRIYEFCEDPSKNLCCRTIYKGTIDWKCLNCGYFQGPNTPPKLCSEYDDMAALMGYNPIQSATLSFSDSYFYCIHCDEYNSYSNTPEDLFKYRQSGRLKLGNYKSTESMIIIKRIYPIPQYKLEWDESLK